MPKHREKLEDKVLSVICEETRFRITRLQCEKVSDLTSTQEEADTQRQLSLLMIQTSSFCVLASPMIFLVPYIKKKRNAEPHTVLCCWQGSQSSRT